MAVTREVVDEGKGVFRYTLSDTGGLISAKVINYGATLTHLIVTDKDGAERDVVLGFDDWSGYKGPDNRYFGAVVGRVANRIAAGKFDLNGKEYSLAVNNGPNALHGGVDGFDKKIWSAEQVPVDVHPAAVTFRLTSEDGEEGYPGKLQVEVTYSVEEDAALKIVYSAKLVETAETSTIVNLTNHSYFNLSGGEDATIAQHILEMSADRYLPTGENSIPTGELSPVEGAGAMDFLSSHAIGERIAEVKPMGYDHCYVLKDVVVSDWTPPKEPQFAVRASCPTTGIVMEFFTTEPGFQFYTAGYNVSEDRSAKASQPNFAPGKHSAFCLEAQRFPDAINKKDWRQMVVLEPGKEYTQSTVYKFSLPSKRSKTDA